jgi:hypothetical protein
MKGDFTKFGFDPTKRFTRVLKQQGRVDLDSDWNEYNDIRNYLERTTRIDTLGHYGAPVDHADAGFAVGFNGADLTFAAGRLYVEGLQCELFQGTTYLGQQFLPNPPALNQTQGNIDAVYLDVWERHITGVEDPSILEVALGGPDTTTRVETVFQIRVAGNVGAITCTQMPPAPVSGGQMTPSVQPAPPPDDPCQLAPTGGYRGLENRLYRVEIHDPGNLGAATFKWSRDDGSIVFPVTEFPAGQPAKIRVAKLGRDQVLALRFNDWVEVLGDQSELSGAPGTMAQITNIDPTNLELTLSADVSAHSAETNPKVRRWDQPSPPIAVAAGPIPLEDGIQVSFAGSNFLSYDYWTFAARTVTGAIEPQPRAWPPLPSPISPAGIIHYYVPLALVTWQVPGNPPQIHDCWPKRPSAGCCCCSVTVGDGATSNGDFTSIQDAIDSFTNRENPAEVCLLPGRYVLDRTVNITRGNLIIHGCGRHSHIVGPQVGPAFSVSQVTDVTFDSLDVFIAGNDPVLAVTSSDRIAVENSEFSGDAGPWVIVAQGGDLRVEENLLGNGGVWVLDGSSKAAIRNNRIVGGSGPGIGLGGLPPDTGPSDSASGVLATEITGNYIAEMGNSGISTVLDGEGQFNEFGDIEDLVIADNVIENCALAAPARPYNTFAVAGILLHHAQGAQIHRNQISGNGATNSIPACGIFGQGPISEVEITNNHIVDNGIAAAPTQRACVDFTQMAVGAIANPYIDPATNAVFAVGAAILRVQSPRCGRQLKRPNRRTATTAVPRIWVQSGKIMGFVARIAPPASSLAGSVRVTPELSGSGSAVLFRANGKATPVWIRLLT